MKLLMVFATIVFALSATTAAARYRPSFTSRPWPSRQQWSTKQQWSTLDPLPIRDSSPPVPSRTAHVLDVSLALASCTANILTETVLCLTNIPTLRRYNDCNIL